MRSTTSNRSVRTKAVCHTVVSMVCLSLAFTPAQQAAAMTTFATATNVACINFGDLPKESAISIRFNNDSAWKPEINKTGAAIATDPYNTSFEVMIWKRLPQSDADNRADNTIIYKLALTPSTSNSCGSLPTNYVIRSGANGYYIAEEKVGFSQTKPKEDSGISAGGVIVGVVVLGVLACLLGACSSSSSSSGSSGSGGWDTTEMDTQRILERQRRDEAAARTAAEQAEQSRAAAAQQERLSTPNALGW